MMQCICFINVLIYGCNVRACKLICCITVWLRKINPWKLLRICWTFMSWSWSTDELLLREVNSIVREMPCTACNICLGNLEKFDDFYWGLIIWSLVLLGIQMMYCGDFLDNSLETFSYPFHLSVIVFLILFICKQ